MIGHKHLIECHCILPQFRNKPDPVFHKFTVFSLLDEASDTVEPKYAACNNCGALHKVYDICKSEISVGNEDAKLVPKKEDFKLSLPNDVYDVLHSYKRDVSDFEMAQYIIDYGKWDSFVILSKEEVEDVNQGKLLKFVASDKFRVESYSNQLIV